MKNTAIDKDYLNDPDRLMRTGEVARLLGVTEMTMQQWRATGDGPSFIKLTSGQYGRVRYKRKDVLDYINSRERIDPVSQVA